MEEKSEELNEEVWGISQAELEELRDKAREQLNNTKHTWRQKGVWLVCKSCEMQHAVYLGMAKIMVGEKEDGTPILANRGEAQDEQHTP